MLLIGLLIGGVVATVLLVDEGEVVTLYTQGANGNRYETQLWVVEQGGEIFVRAHFAKARWLARVRSRPEVELRRGEATQSFFAGPVDDPEVRGAVNRAMAKKYGLADRLASAVWDPEKSIPVHLHRNDVSSPRP
jgi:hypothetical protein